MQTPVQAQRLTAKELWDLACEDPTWRRYELDVGVPTEMTPASPRHGVVEANLVLLFKLFLRDHPIGELLCGDVGFQLDGETMRAPDVAFLSNERLAGTPLPEKGWYPGPPDLAVEVLSPEDRPTEVLSKAAQFLRAGTRLVWLVDPQDRAVTVLRPGTEIAVLREPAGLGGEDVLPGFGCTVRELFG